MKAISLWQPWASAIALGAKRIETRGWQTKHRGRLAIHAARRRVKSELERLEEAWFFRGVFWTPGEHPISELLPFGAIVATANLVDCVPTQILIRKKYRHLNEVRRHDGAPEECFWTEFYLGDYSHGRYGWMLEDIKALKEPVPFRGAQGVFNVPDSLVEGVLI